MHHVSFIFFVFCKMNVGGEEQKQNITQKKQLKGKKEENNRYLQNRM